MCKIDPMDCFALTGKTRVLPHVKQVHANQPSGSPRLFYSSSFVPLLMQDGALSFYSIAAGANSPFMVIHRFISDRLSSLSPFYHGYLLQRNILLQFISRLYDI